MQTRDLDVVVYKQENANYPAHPYNPQEIYPEFKRFSVFRLESDKKNETYQAVRQILADIGLDKDNFGTENWNPLKSKIQKGQIVLIKPNLVYHEHPLGNREVLSMISNAALLRPIIDYILLATNGNVEIIVGDAPVQGGDFYKAAKISGIFQLIDFYKNRGIKIQLIDFRLLISKQNRRGILSKKFDNPERKKDMYCVVDLKQKSELIDIIDKSSRLEITDYGYGAVKKHHNNLKNEYIIPKEILNADLFINLPKLKTHRKAGLTCAMKNLVGINGDKTCIAHHTRGTYANGGDEFNKANIKTIFRVRIWNFLKTNKFGIQIAGMIKLFFEKIIWRGKKLKQQRMENCPAIFFEGSWHGNDTVWRCVKDLNKIIFYADKHGMMQKTPQRQYLCIVDAILAGEREGPMEQSTKNMGVVLGGENPVYIDVVAAKLMKYDYRKIPIIRQAFVNRWWSLTDKKAEDITYSSNKSFDSISQYFVPSYGWKDILKEKQ